MRDWGWNRPSRITGRKPCPLRSHLRGDGVEFLGLDLGASILVDPDGPAAVVGRGRALDPFDARLDHVGAEPPVEAHPAIEPLAGHLAIPARILVVATKARVASVVIIGQGDGQIPRLIADVESSLGPIDILINNAGTNIRGPVTDLTEADWDTVIDTNLKGPFMLARAI